MSIIGCANCGGTHYGSNECPYLEKNMGEPCAVCGERTSYCCSDCAIDGAGKVYVCITDACRTTHETKHAKPPIEPGNMPSACREAIDWLKMQALIFRTDGKVENAKMASHTAALIASLQPQK